MVSEKWNARYVQSKMQQMQTIAKLNINLTGNSTIDGSSSSYQDQAVWITKTQKSYQTGSEIAVKSDYQSTSDTCNTWYMSDIVLDQSFRPSGSWKLTF